MVISRVFFFKFTMVYLGRSDVILTMTQLCDNTHLKRDVFSGVLIPQSFTFLAFSMKKTPYRGYYTVERRYEFYVRVAGTISHE